MSRTHQMLPIHSCKLGVKIVRKIVPHLFVPSFSYPDAGVCRIRDRTNSARIEK